MGLTVLPLTHPFFSRSLQDFLKNKRVLQLDLPLMIAGAKERGELESRVTRLVAELKEDKNVVLMWVAGGAGCRDVAAAGLDLGLVCPIGVGSTVVLAHRMLVVRSACAVGCCAKCVGWCGGLGHCLTTHTSSALGSITTQVLISCPAHTPAGLMRSTLWWALALWAVAVAAAWTSATSSSRHWRAASCSASVPPPSTSTASTSRGTQRWSAGEGRRCAGQVMKS